MEILTLLKANIRRKKGSFLSIIILMIIISMSLTAILSIKDNCENSIQKAMEQIDAGDITIYVKSENLTDEVLKTVEKHSMVEKVKKYPAIASYNPEVNGYAYGNDCFLLKLRKEYKILNNDLTGYADKTPSLKSGEIYVTQGFSTNMNCTVGDTIKIYTIGGEYDLKIKGIIIEPCFGSYTIGVKQFFISDQDFELMYSDAKLAEDENMSSDFQILQIYKSNNCTLSVQQFKRQLNLDTGIIDCSLFSLTKTMSEKYTNLFPEIILSVLLVFMVFLLLIVLIVIGHSVSTGIEMEYVSLGILKSQGFTVGKIRAVFFLQYILAQIIGTIVGIILSIPLVKSFGNIFQPITSIPADNNISLIKSLMFILMVILISILFIFILTRKIGKISAVRAISGGRKEIYFDSRMKIPISKKSLSASLALRQFTSGKRRYIGTIIIVSFLVFFMMTISILGNVLNSKSAVESLGERYVDCSLSLNPNIDDKTFERIENTVEKFSPIEKKYYLSSSYMSINGEELWCAIYKNPESINVLKGRAPLYDNEIVITSVLSDEFNLKIGDKVTVSNKDKKSDFIISGLYQCMNDAGLNFSMPLSGAKKIGYKSITYGGYTLSDNTQCEEIVAELNKEFGDILKATVDESELDDMYVVAINAMKAFIYVFSIIFALVVVIMICSKVFLREKTDIGIYKALGFTHKRLRLQFAVRFLIVAIIGSAIGSVLSVFLSGKLISMMLRSMGISSFTSVFTPFTFIAPILLICICFFMFAYLVFRKVKKVGVKELITE